MRENNIIRKCLKVLEDIQLHFADQCVYNYLFKNNVKYLELAYEALPEDVYKNVNFKNIDLL